MNPISVDQRLRKTIQLLSQGVPEKEEVPVYPTTFVSPKSPAGVQIQYERLEAEVDSVVKEMLDNVVTWENVRLEALEKKKKAAEEIKKISENLQTQKKDASKEERDAISAQLEEMKKVRDLLAEHVNQAEETTAIVQKYENGALVLQRKITEIQVEPDELDILQYKLDLLTQLHPKISSKLDKLVDQFIDTNTMLEQELEDVVRIVQRQASVNRVAVNWLGLLTNSVKGLWKLLSTNIRTTYDTIKGFGKYVDAFDTLVKTL